MFTQLRWFEAILRVLESLHCRPGREAVSFCVTSSFFFPEVRFEAQADGAFYRCHEAERTGQPKPFDGLTQLWKVRSPS